MATKKNDGKRNYSVTFQRGDDYMDTQEVEVRAFDIEDAIYVAQTQREELEAPRVTGVAEV